MWWDSGNVDPWWGAQKQFVDREEEEPKKFYLQPCSFVPFFFSPFFRFFFLKGLQGLAGRRGPAGQTGEKVWFLNNASTLGNLVH